MAEEGISTKLSLSSVEAYRENQFNDSGQGGGGFATEKKRSP